MTKSGKEREDSPMSERETYIFEEPTKGGYAVKVEVDRGYTSRVTVTWDHDKEPIVKDIPLALLRKLVAFAERPPRAPNGWRADQ